MKRLLIIIVLWTLALVLLITWETLALPAERSSRWDAVRRHHLEQEPACAVCGGEKDCRCITASRSTLAAKS